MNEQMIAIAKLATSIAPWVGITVGAVVMFLSREARSRLGQFLAVVLTGISVGVIAARLP